MKKINVLLATVLLFLSPTFISAKEITRVILFTIDGLHWEAPAKLKMPVLNALIEEGTYIRRSCMIIPHHPTIGDYSKYNSCSFPNPMLHGGTIFIRPENKMLQEMISPKYQTAFVVNTDAYRSVGRGFTVCIMDPSLTDNEVISQAIGLLESQDLRFMRVHLQTPGMQGVSVAMDRTGKPYSKNIWGKDSPYIDAIENADKLLGRFIDYLRTSGKWENTVLVVTSDHGQSNVGWHPMLDEDSWTTVLVFAGQGIARGRRLSYFEHTNLAPTIAWLLGVDAPGTDGGAGKPVKEILEEYEDSEYNPPQHIKTINQQIRSYNILHAKIVLAACNDNYLSNLIASLENENLTPEPFYHQNRITDWHKAGTTEHLIEANKKILEKMQSILNQK